MCANIMSAMLCAAACADAVVCVCDGADGAASLVAELLHAPMAATAASAAIPVATVLDLLTEHPFRSDEVLPTSPVSHPGCLAVL